MKGLRFCLICLMLFFVFQKQKGFCEAYESYFTEFGTEIEVGQEEKEDAIVDSLDQYYNFSKNMTYLKRNIGVNTDLKFQVDNGIKDYTDDALDNHFYYLKLNCMTKLSALWDFDFGLKYGEVSNEKDNLNSYFVMRLEPKLIFNVETWRVFGSFGWQIKEFEYRKKQDVAILEDKTQAILDSSFNCGIDKQISENSYLSLKYSWKYLTEDNIDVAGANKMAHSAKIGYYWKR
jgi:hypothetical protein